MGPLEGWPAPATLAQLVEHSLGKGEVVGSSPMGGSGTVFDWTPGVGVQSETDLGGGEGRGKPASIVQEDDQGRSVWAVLFKSHLSEDSFPWLRVFSNEPNRM